MKTAVSTKGQIVIPAEIRQQDEIEAGQEFEIERVDRGEYLLRRLSPPPNHGLLDWLELHALSRWIRLQRGDLCQRHYRPEADRAEDDRDHEHQLGSGAQQSNLGE